MRYHVQGRTGPVVLVINGGPGWSSEHMRGVADVLARSRCVIRFDQPGTSGSPVVVDAASVGFDAIVEDIERLRVGLGIRRWSVLGHSFGGMVAMAYVARHQAAVAGLVLSAPGAPTLDFLTWYQDSLTARLSGRDQNLATGLFAHLQADPADRSAAADLVRAMAPAYVADTRQVPLLRAMIDDTTWTVGVATIVWRSMADGAYDLRTALPSIRVPTLVVHGARDALGTEIARGIATAIPGATRVEVEGAAHIIWLDRPTAYWAAVERFLGAIDRAGQAR
ncbi:MAG: alpha/beta hydrolase [Gemmatimonadetes bacterium]|nr:alpha/beta hydrolase [Gemmatimonadota bacterium]MCB9519199.1 alpha/beta hydrolase [Gemmatimonadales bacterium]HRY09965.1 alpha/beta hydrolase [Candidatus Nanopelagicales bacterium]